MVRGGINNIIGRCLSGKHTEPIMVTRGNGNVFHTCSFCKLYPCLCIKALWIKKNGESIYGTRGNVVTPQQWGVVTAKNKTLYAHVLNMPQQPYIFLPWAKGKVTKVILMNDGSNIRYKQQAEGVFVYADNIKPDAIDTIIELTTN